MWFYFCNLNIILMIQIDYIIKVDYIDIMGDRHKTPRVYESETQKRKLAADRKKMP